MQGLLLLTLIFAAILGLIKGQDIERYRLLTNDKMNKSEADAACQTIGDNWGLPSDTSPLDHQNLSEEIVRRGWTSMWLSHQRIILNKWTWVNDTLYSGQLGTSAAANCAYLATEDGKVVREANCFTRNKRGYICMLKDRKCPHGVLAQATLCVQKQSHSYILGCAADSWYAARYICNVNGGDLLSDTTSVGLETYYSQWCKNIWIGLRKEKWFPIYPRGIKEEIKESYWESSGSEGIFAVLTQLERSKTEYRWQISAGHEENHFICQNYDKSLTPSLPDKETGPTVSKPLVNQENKLRGAVIALSLILVVLLSSLAVLIYIVYRFKQKRRTSIFTENISVTTKEVHKPMRSEYSKVDQSKFSTPDIPALYATSDDVTRQEPENHYYTGASTAPRNKNTSLKRVKPKTKPPPPPKIDPTMAHLYAVPDVKRKSVNTTVEEGVKSFLVEPVEDNALIVVENDIYSEPDEN